MVTSGMASHWRAPFFQSSAEMLLDLWGRRKACGLDLTPERLTWNFRWAREGETSKSQFSMGKSTISMAIFNSKLLVYQRVTPAMEIPIILLPLFPSLHMIIPLMDISYHWWDIDDGILGFNAIINPLMGMLMIYLQDGATSRDSVQLRYDISVAEKTMVYGRYNELVHGVYKPANIIGGHHPVVYPLVN